MIGVVPAELGADHRAGVVAHGPVSLVAEPRHQLRPRSGDALVGPARLAGRAREAEAGKGGDHEVERVGRSRAVRPRVRERFDHVDELDDRARPAVCHDQRERVRLGRTDVEEVDVLAIDRGRELGEPVQPGLPRAPVVAVQPAVRKASYVRERDPVVGPGPGHLVRPAGSSEPVSEVVEVLLGDVDPVRSDVVLHGHASLPCYRGTERSLPS